VAQGSDYGIYTVLLDGRPPQAPQLEHEPGAEVRPALPFDGYAPETYVGLAHPVGWVRLTAGRHRLTFQCLGKNQRSAGYSLGLDNLVLARIGPEAWAAAGRLEEPRLPAGDAIALGRTLTAEADPVLRGLAALALRDRGRAALPALPALLTGLKDAEASVRLMCANAIAGIGPDAAAAVPALIDAAGVSREQVHVLRSVASALGRIGRPAAVPALPRLRELAAIPRIRWAATAAIRQIE
jgi:hypothetical protein